MTDFRFAIRQLLKSPGFSAVAVLSIGLGIGVNTTVFSWVQGVLLHPLTGVEQADELVTLETIAPSGEFIASSYPDYRDYRDQADRLAGLIAFQDRPLILGEESDPEWVWSECVSGNFFDVLRVRPALGRFFRTEEGAEQPGAHPVVVISQRL